MPQDLSALGADFVADPYPVYARLRERGPVHRVRTDTSGEFWLVVGHEEARAALTDPRLSNDVRHSAAWQDDGGNAIGRNMVQTDPPHHTRLRGLVARAFTPARIEALRPRVRQIADGLLDAMAPLGRADLVEDYALPLPLAVICELLGVPETDRKAFHDWYLESTDLTRPEAAGAAVQALTGYFAELIEAKRRGHGEDLLSALVRTMAGDGDALSDEEMLGMTFVLLVAGYETSANLISSGTLALLRHPEQLAALRADWSLLDGAIEEMLRYDGPVESAAFRFTREPVEIAGTTIPAGEPVGVVLAAGSRDPRRFAEPDRFDIRRAPRGHLAFGHGVHHCLGAPLARLEGAIAFRALLERCPDLALDADPAELAWRPSLMLRGLRRLPIRFTPAPDA
ncbi:MULTISPECIES: cytochrome P450 family protein [Streptomyces]|uniref:Cytochrome P450 n=1 Tax=Streptomyces rhizosphaericus TaxID=114699 RepID=A0A6G4AVH5_9ACTN|nr:MULTISPECIES: cytochrome P450 [Streptomyces]MBA6434270.1 cytochrome P450 [Streptomyces sp. GMR22]MBI0380217.1 cytochrome P450 [Streptomyces albiflaviniger]NEW77248.1 cytochrome P450 [Streptomyces rhizosphaericus]